METDRIVKCKNCNKEFELSDVQFKRYLANPLRNNFCSKSCSALYRNKTVKALNTNTERDTQGRYKKKEYNISEGICKNCGNKFKLTEYQKKRVTKDPTANVFCSKSCSAKYSNAHRSNEWKETAKRNNKLIYGVEHYVNKEQISKTIKKLYETKEDYGFKSKKYKRMMLEKYGVENIAKSDWIKKHNLEKYGVEHYFQCDDYKQKTIATNRVKYGVDWHMQSAEQVDKYRQTVRERYGVNWITDVPEVSEKIKQTLIDKYTAGYTTNRFISKVNQQFIDVLNSLKVENTPEFYIYPYFYDIKVDKYLIEINPTISHNSTYNIYGGDIKPDYHQNKTKVANNAGYRCVHIFDWDDCDKIISNILPRKTMYARQLEIKEVSEKFAGEFLDLYHYQNSCRGQKFCLGLYNGDTLVQVMTFGKPRYNKNYEWELLRLCTKPEIVIVGGAERLFKHFLDITDAQTVVSYCDLSKFSGDVYTKLGFQLISVSKPTVHWYNMKTNRHITDNLLRQRGFSKLHGDVKYERYARGLDNKQLMLDNGYVEVYDCGQATYEYKR